MRWTPIPERIASFVSKLISLKVKAHADSQVPNPAIPMIGRADDSSAPVIPRIFFQKLRLLKENP